MSIATLERETDEQQIVAFHLANEIYALEIATIHEIILLPEITAIPRTTSDIQGVINLRGKIVPIIDLRLRLGLPQTATNRNTRIVVVEHNEITVGMIVDDVVGVIRLPASSVEPPSKLITELDTEYISGVGKYNEDLIIMLNIHQLLKERARH